MSSHITIATEKLLTPSGLSLQDLEQVIKTMSKQKLSFSDIYLQHNQSEIWTIDEGVVKGGGYNINRGVGIRAVHEAKTGFTYTSDISLPSMISAAKTARAISSSTNDSYIHHQIGSVVSPDQKFYTEIDPASTISKNEKISIILNMERKIRAKTTFVKQVQVRIKVSHSVVLIVRSDGLIAADSRPLITIYANSKLDKNGVLEMCFDSCSVRASFEELSQENVCNKIVDELIRQADIKFDAKDAPAGEMTVVLGPGNPGVLLHEAVGHGLEGDFNRKQTSIFSNRVGEKVASSLCTVIDSGSVQNKSCGTLHVDDEGTPTQKNVLIENGVLKGYMQDSLNARLMKELPTGNGRRQSFAHLPMPRMTNTYMAAGPHDPEEIISSVKKGIYATKFGGGEVDIVSGNFVFSAVEAYMIENGKVTYPIKGATLIGNGPEVIKKISMVANDLHIDSSGGYCGKNGQAVSVGIGQPTLKIDNITVGGSKLQ